MTKIKAPPPKKSKAKGGSVKKHNKINMDKVTIKRVKRNKKKITTSEKIMAGVGVGSSLLGGIGAVSPQTEQQEFVRVNDQEKSNSKTSAIKQALTKIFGVQSAKASGVEDLQAAVADAQRALNDFNNWVSEARADAQNYETQEDIDARLADIEATINAEKPALDSALADAQAALNAYLQEHNDSNPIGNPVGGVTHAEGDEGEVEGRSAHWKMVNGNLVLIEDAGHSVENSNGYFYTSDGNGYWKLDDGQEKVEGGVKYVSQNGEWVRMEQEVDPDLTPVSGANSYSHSNLEYDLDSISASKSLDSLGTNVMIVTGQVDSWVASEQNNINNWVNSAHPTQEQANAAYTFVTNSSKTAYQNIKNAEEQTRNKLVSEGSTGAQGPQNGETRNGTDGIETYRDGQWVLNAGYRVQNPNGLYYMSNGSGGWILDSTQDDQDGGTLNAALGGNSFTSGQTYRFNGTDWYSLQTRGDLGGDGSRGGGTSNTPKEGDTRQGVDGTEMYKNGQWVLEADIRVLNPNGFYYLSDGNGNWSLDDVTATSTPDVRYTYHPNSDHTAWVLDDGQTDEVNHPGQITRGGIWITNPTGGTVGSTGTLGQINTGSVTVSEINGLNVRVVNIVVGSGFLSLNGTSYAPGQTIRLEVVPGGGIYLDGIEVSSQLTTEDVVRLHTTLDNYTPGSGGSGTETKTPPATYNGVAVTWTGNSGRDANGNTYSFNPETGQVTFTPAGTVATPSNGDSRNFNGTIQIYRNGQWGPPQAGDKFVDNAGVKYTFTNGAWVADNANTYTLPSNPTEGQAFAIGPGQVLVYHSDNPGNHWGAPRNGDIFTVPATGEKLIYNSGQWISTTSTTQAIVTREANGDYTVRVGSVSFTGKNPTEVLAKLQQAYQTYLGYANGSVRIDQNTYNAMSTAITMYGSGAIVNMQGGSTGAYYEQGDVRIFRDANGQYQIQIITNEPITNPQTGQRSYNLVLTASSIDALNKALTDAIKANGKANEQTLLMFTNAQGDLSLFRNQEQSGQFHFTFQTNPQLNNPNGTGTSGQNAFQFATQDTAKAVASLLAQAGLKDVKVVGVPVGNLTMYTITVGDSGWQGNAGLIANTIQTGGLDYALNLVRTEIAESRGNFSTNYQGTGTGGAIGATSQPIKTTSGTGGATSTSGPSYTLPTGFGLPPGGFPPGTPLPNGLVAGPNGTVINPSTGKVVATAPASGSGSASTGGNGAVNTAGQITTNALAAGTVGVAYNQNLASSFSSPTWALLSSSSLPPGLTLNASTGKISGTPTQAGSYNVAIVATQGNASAIKVLNIIINQASSNNTGTAQIVTTALPNATVGSTYNFKLESSLDGEQWGILGTAALPPGLTLNQSTGVISGTPTAAGTYNIAFVATKGNTSAVKVLTLTVLPGASDNNNNDGTGGNGGGSGGGGNGGSGSGTGGNSSNGGNSNGSGNSSNTNAQITALQNQIAALQNQLSQMSGSGASNAQITSLQNQINNLTNLLNNYNSRGVVASSVAGIQYTNLGSGFEPGYTPEGYANTNRPAGLAMPAGYRASGAQVPDSGLPAGFYFGAPGSQTYQGSQVQGVNTAGTTYTVKKGDTLWNIAKKYYGDGRQWRKIMEANSDKVKNPKTLKIGTVLVIPGANQ